MERTPIVVATVKRASGLGARSGRRQKKTRACLQGDGNETIEHDVGSGSERLDNISSIDVEHSKCIYFNVCSASLLEMLPGIFQ